MKPTKRLIGYCLFLTLTLLLSHLQAAFLVDVHINGSKNPSLSFGEDADDKESPFPPFSGMFGVVDVCFASRKAEPQEWFDRLADDIIQEDETNKWTLVAKSNARVTWKKRLDSGNIPENLKIVWTDIKNGEFKEALVSDGATLSLKAGTTYTIKRGASQDDVQETIDPTTGYARKVEGEMQSIEFTMPPAAGAPDDVTIRLTMNAGIDVIRYEGEEGKENARWEVVFTANGYSVTTYAWDENDPNILVITLKRDGTRGDDDWKLSLKPLANSAAPMEVSDADGDGATYGIGKVLHAILLKFGTLDFDGNGSIEIYDVMYLYNFIANGSPEFSEDPAEEHDNIAGLLDFTDKSPEDQEAMDAAKTAIEIFRSDADSLKFDGSADDVNIYDIMYFYNFLANGFPEFSEDPAEEHDNIAGLLDFTDKSPENQEDFAAAQAAIETLRDYKNNL